MNRTSTSYARFRHTLVWLALASAFPIAAQAEDAPADKKDEPGQLATVIVTAQRRAENIREVPVSISTLKGENLDVLNSGGEDIRFLASRVPSLNIESSYGRAFPRFYIRGLGNTDFDLNASQPVSLVYDDVVQENPILKGFPVFDLDQIEVLRGPQGTLFGRNSPAGVIKFDSAKPVNHFEGYVNAGYGSHNSLNLEGAINVPINQDWAMRVSMQAQHRDNWVTNVAPVTQQTHEFEGYDDDAARVQLLYKPSKDFSALLNLHARDMTGSARLFRANIIQKGSNDLVPGFDASTIATDGKNEQSVRSHGGSLRLKWNFGDLTLHSITGYESVSAYSRGDIDGGYGASFAPPMGPGFIPFPAESADRMLPTSQWSQEFRLESNYKAPLNWITGVYYFKENIHIQDYDFNTLGGGVQDGYAVQHQSNTAWAWFGTLNYAVNDQFKLRGGIRYTSDKKDFEGQRLVSPIGGGATPVLTLSPSASNVSWDLSGDYALDKETNIYARIATGFRAPSVQGRLMFANSLSQADSETVQSVEVGIKKDLFNRRARMSFDVYDYTIKNMELTAVGGTNNVTSLLNADRAHGQGFEFDFQANLSDHLKATLGASYNYTELRDANLKVATCGSGCTVLNPTVNVGGNTYAYVNGNPLPQAPKWTLNGSLGYTIPGANGDYFVYTDWSYRSEVNFFLYNSTEYTGRAMLIGGLRAGYKFGDGKYEVAAYGRNITNQTRIVGGIDFNNLTGFINEPRVWGVQFKANF